MVSAEVSGCGAVAPSKSPVEAGNHDIIHVIYGHVFA